MLLWMRVAGRVPEVALRVYGSRYDNARDHRRWRKRELRAAVKRDRVAVERLVNQRELYI